MADADMRNILTRRLRDRPAARKKAKKSEQASTEEAGDLIRFASVSTWTERYLGWLGVDFGPENDFDVLEMLLAKENHLQRQWTIEHKVHKSTLGTAEYNQSTMLALTT